MKQLILKILSILNPIFWWRYFNLMSASSLVENGRYIKAKKILKGLLKKGSVSEYHYYLLGKIYLKDKEYDTAKKCFEHSIEYNQFENIYKANTLFYLALTQYELKDFKGATPNFKKAIEIKEKTRFEKNTVISIPNLYCYLGRSYVELNQPEKAFETFNKGLKYEPNNEALQRELTLLGIG